MPAGAILVRKAIFFIPALCAACAFTYPVLKVGDNSYQIAAIPSPIRRNIDSAKTLAVSRAGKKCDSIGKHMAVTKIEAGHAYPASDGIVVIFTCT
jgi:hypothetical protein